MKELEIRDLPSNNSAISNVIDLNNSLCVNFNDIQNFFENYVEIENLKIKNVYIPKIEKNKGLLPAFRIDTIN